METIVITDGYCMNPGDLDWSPVYQLGNVRYYDRTPAAEVAERCAEATVIITNKTPIDANTLKRATNLKLIVVAATGFNIVDTVTAKSLGIPVCNIPEYSTFFVAQHTFALILELTNQVGWHSQSVSKGEWARCADWSYSRSPLMELKDKTLGIVGMGRIGRRSADIANAFGMHVIHYRGKADASLSTAVDLKTLAAESDFISLHCPLTPENRGFVNMEFLQSMKRTAFLINTARGPLIQETDLSLALQQGVIAGAALDVLSTEPPPDNILWTLPNCIVTPHQAWSSFEARQRLMKQVTEHLAAGIAGEPFDVVNP
jgi:glycerate dehydrogenase